MNAEQLDFWRKTVAGEAGFNGQPQALLKLMSVSDAENLRRLALVYPEAVRAFREDRGETYDRGEPAPKITLTFISDGVETAPEEYATGDLGEAVRAMAGRSFGEGQSAGPEAWVFCLKVEQGDASMSRAAVAKTLRSIASLQELHASRELEGAGG